MFKGMGDLFGQVQKMQLEMKRIQDELEKKTVEATVGGGMVRVVATGKQHIKSIQIDPETLKMNDKQMLEDLIASGVNEAIKQSQELAANEMKSLTAGLGPIGSMLNMGG